LIVEFDNRKLVRRTGHETVKRLMLRVRHDPCRRPHLNRRKAFEAVIGLRHGHRVPPLAGRQAVMALSTSSNVAARTCASPWHALARPSSSAAR
jgi:hypothetical protein